MADYTLRFVHPSVQWMSEDRPEFLKETLFDSIVSSLDVHQPKVSHSI